MRKLIRRINKLKRYSQMQADIAEQRDILQKRCNKSQDRLCRLENEKYTILRVIDVLTEER